MAIHVLDAHTAELIAAGEVVERPAAVVKELCENAIDANASQITVEIERGGIALIRVTDNGTGLPKEDIPIAFLRHATSKVRTQDDLDAIHTLGFRGEALPSIASVSKVRLTTKTAQQSDAYCYSIEGGCEVGLQLAPHPVGTTFEVRQLFYNTPARMKFLKKDASEGSFVNEVVASLALSHPEIGFKLLREGKQIFATPGDGKLKSAVYAVLGAAFAKGLAEVHSSDGSVQVSGLVTLPHACRASRSMQYFYLNGRYIKNNTIMAALEQAYRGLAMQGRFAGAVLVVNMPAGQVDVNVHPAKTQVRFANANEVFTAVYRAVKAAVAGVQLQNTLRLQQEDDKAFVDVHTDIAKNVESTAKSSEFDGSLQSNSDIIPYAVHSGARPYVGVTVPPRAPSLDVEYTQTEKLEPLQDKIVHVEAIQESFTEKEEQPQIKLIGEVFKTYIVAEWAGSLCLIDKHAAHERIIYEKLASEYERPCVQQLLTPLSITLGASEKVAMLESGQTLANVGIEIEDFGGNTVLVRGVPADIDVGNIEDFVARLAGELLQNSLSTSTERLRWVLHSVACRAAVKAGDKTGKDELLKLARDILSGEVPQFCPHGRPVVLRLKQSQLEKQFGRLG